MGSIKLFFFSFLLHKKKSHFDETDDRQHGVYQMSLYEKHIFVMCFIKTRLKWQAFV